MKPKGRILVIDDSPAVLDGIKTSLTLAGYEVVATSQVVGAARHLRNCSLVILDYHMPGMNGEEVLRSLRSAAAAAQKKTRFYLYTSDEKVATGSWSKGFDGVFTQKGNEEALVRQVDAIFRMIKLQSFM